MQELLKLMKNTDGSKNVEHYINEGNALFQLQKENWDIDDAYKKFCRMNQLSPNQNIEGNNQEGGSIHNTSDIHTASHKSNGKYFINAKDIQI